MSTTESVSSHARDTLALAIELAGRVAVAFIALAYFTSLPSGADAGWRFEPLAAIAGLLLYLGLQSVLFARAIGPRGLAAGPAIAALADAVGVFGCIASDPAAVPPTLALALLAALNAAWRGAWLAAALAGAGAVAVTTAALLLREQTLGLSLGHDSAFLVALLGTGLLAFVALALRRGVLQAQAARFADQDVETQLLNRRGFDTAARYLVPLHQRTQLPLVIVLASLDTRSAKPLDAGTLAAAVRQVGHVVRQRARRSDVVARLSADEFIFMLFDTPLAGGETLARSMLERFDTWASREGLDVRLTFGMVNTPDEPVAIEQLIARARGAVQRAQKHPSSPSVVTAPSL